MSQTETEPLVNETGEDDVQVEIEIEPVKPKQVEKKLAMQQGDKLKRTEPVDATVKTHISYDEYGNAFIGEDRFYSQKSLDNILKTRTEENERLSFLNKAISEGVPPAMADNLSKALDVTKLDDFDYSQFIQKQVQSQGIATPNPDNPAKEKTDLELARELRDK